MEENIKVTKKWINSLWSITEGSYKEISIQQYRFIIYLFSIFIQDQYTPVLDGKKVFNECFSYKNKLGKIKYLMNKYKWKEFRQSFGTLLRYDDRNNTIQCNFNNHQQFFKINGTPKKDWDETRLKEIGQYNRGKMNPDNIRPEYTEGAYFNLKKSTWEQLRLTKSFNLIKIFHFIMSEKVRGPYPIIKIELLQLRLMIQIKQLDLRQFKIELTSALNELKEIGFIKSYEYVHPFEIKIEK